MSSSARSVPLSSSSAQHPWTSYRQSMPPPEFHPRTCSHAVTDSGPRCGLALLDQVSKSTPSLPSRTRGSGSSSTGSSSSLHTQAGVGGFGQGNGWIQPSIWSPPAIRSRDRSSTSVSDDYHLLNMADHIVEEGDQGQDLMDDLLFNPSIQPPPRIQTKKGSNFDPAQLSSTQIAALAAAFASPVPSTLQSQSPQVAQLVIQATRLAKGLALPPANRGFRAKASDMMDRDESNTTVFVGGLSQGVTESVLNDIFTPYGAIAYVKIPPGKGCGFVQFHSKQDAEHAIRQMQGFECLGCSLRTHWGKSQSAEKVLSTGAVSDQVAGQVVSVCSALGVPKEHAELVMRVLAACSAGSESG